MTRESLLLEIGCEEIPARMIQAAATDLGKRVLEILDKAGLDHGDHRVWGGPRRLAVRVADVVGRQEDRDEERLGPPASVAFGPDGALTRAGAGFARKEGIEPEALQRLETPKGAYAGFRRSVTGLTVGQLLEAELPRSVSAMWFPKTMRWGDGTHRWVRPVHWVVALHGEAVLSLGLFGQSAGRQSLGHRFLHGGSVEIAHADRYEASLLEGHVVVDPVERKRRLADALDRAAKSVDGGVVEDAGLLDEVSDLAEWPGVVCGTFERAFLDLPRELLVTTLRHHQKCFSVHDGDGVLLPAFLAVADTTEDPSGHIRRGNEWVVGGRLDDARFFWREDRKRTLADRSAELERVMFHAKVGTYAEKARRMGDLAGSLATHLGLPSKAVECCRSGGFLAKNDLVTGTVGEFPELQGQVGGLLLEADGAPAPVASAVYHHYRPAGPDDSIPPDDVSCVVALADKLDSTAGMVAKGEVPTGSRDPFGLRRAASGIFRIAIERGWAVSIDDLTRLGGGDDPLREFLVTRLGNFLRDSGSTANEIQAVFRQAVDPGEAARRPLHDLAARLGAIATVRERDDFAHLVSLTRRVDNILTQGAELLGPGSEDEAFDETMPAAIELAGLVRSSEREIRGLESESRYPDVVDRLAGFVQPVDRFFEDVLVLDPSNPAASRSRGRILSELRELLTRCFDIRELAGQAERRG